MKLGFIKSLGCPAVVISVGLLVPASALAAGTPGPPSYFSGAPGSAMTVPAGRGGNAAQLTSEAGGGYGGVSVNFPAGVDFSSLTSLSTGYNMTQGTCGNGAPRFLIDLADSSNNYIGTLLAYIGPGASLNGDPCPAADNAWTTQPNVATVTDPDTTRWDFAAASGGPVPSNTLQSYASEEALLGGYQMLDAQVVDDGAYGTYGPIQQVQLQNWNVNGQVYFPFPGGNFGNVTCTGPLPAGTYQNVTVSAGQHCLIDGTDNILGNVTVQNGASLQDGDFANGGAPIGGNLQANNALWIDLGHAGSIGGDLQVTGTTSKPGPGATTDGATVNDLCNTTVGGNVSVQNNGAGAPFDVGSAPDCGAGLTITGNLTVQNNAGRVDTANNRAQGNISVQNNTGNGTLSNNSARQNCQLQNDNPPITGSGNTAGAGHTNTCNRTA